MSVFAEPVDTADALVDYVRRRGCVRGDKLPSIRRLAEALGIGPNAARDAVLRAQMLGLVKIEPRLGVFVVNPEAVAQSGAATKPTAAAGDVHNVFHLVDARLLVERELVGKAAAADRPEELLPVRQALDAVLIETTDRDDFVRADEAFHLAVARLAGNPVLTSFLRTLLERLRPVKAEVSLSPESRRRTDREHIELYRCLLEGRADAAQAIVGEHIARGRTLLLEQLRDVPDSKRAKPAPAAAPRRRKKS